MHADIQSLVNEIQTALNTINSETTTEAGTSIIQEAITNSFISLQDKKDKRELYKAVMQKFHPDHLAKTEPALHEILSEKALIGVLTEELKMHRDLYQNVLPDQQEFLKDPVAIILKLVSIAEDNKTIFNKYKEYPKFLADILGLLSGIPQLMLFVSTIVSVISFFILALIIGGIKLCNDFIVNFLTDGSFNKSFDDHIKACEPIYFERMRQLWIEERIGYLKQLKAETEEEFSKEPPALQSAQQADRNLVKAMSDLQFDAHLIREKRSLMKLTDSEAREKLVTNMVQSIIASNPDMIDDPDAVRSRAEEQVNIRIRSENRPGPIDMIPVIFKAARQAMFKPLPNGWFNKGAVIAGRLIKSIFLMPFTISASTLEVATITGFVLVFLLPIFSLIGIEFAFHITVSSPLYALDAIQWLFAGNTLQKKPPAIGAVPSEKKLEMWTPPTPDPMEKIRRQGEPAASMDNSVPPTAREPAQTKPLFRGDSEVTTKPLTKEELVKFDLD